MDQLDLQNETTENLFAFLNSKDDPSYKEIAASAFIIFCNRFQLDLMKKLVPVCRNWGYGDHVASEIGHKTFERAWKYPSYNHTVSKQSDFDTGVRFWLFGISRHLLADHRKFETEERSPFTGEEDIMRDFPDVDRMEATKERKAIVKERYEHIKKALARFSEKHKIIYLTYKQYEAETQEGYKLPRKLLTKLRDELDLTQSTVRAYKNDAFNAVNTYLDIYGSK